MDISALARNHDSKKLSHGAGLLALAAFAGISAWGTLKYFTPSSGIAPIWLPDGAALAGLLLCQRKYWWQYLLICLTAIFVGGRAAGTPLEPDLVLPSLATLEVFVAAVLMRPYSGTAPNLSQPAIFWHFCLFAIGVAPVGTALLAGCFLSLAFHAPLFATITQFYLGHALGVAIVTPLLLGLVNGDLATLFRGGQRVKTLRNWPIVMLVVCAVFYQTSYPLLFIVPPVLLAVAGVQGLASVMLNFPCLVLVAIIGTEFGHGPMALVRGNSMEQKILLIQLFLICNYIVLCFIANIATERRMTIAKLSQLAMLDGLTGIANRRCFNESLVNEWRRVMRRHEALSLLMLDIDNFKAFNDVYGHLEGDACLARLAHKITGFAHRAGDLAARYGGEEFVVLLPECKEADARRIAERIRESIEALKIAHNGNKDHGSVVTASIGVATLRPLFAISDNDCLALIDQADKALYEAKRTGRNKIVSMATIETDLDVAPGADEAQRLAAINDCLNNEMLFSEQLNTIACLAATVLNAQVGLVSLVGREEQVFLGRYGVDITRTPRDVSFCAHTLNGDTPLVVHDALLDRRFQSNALVTGEAGIRFYAGAPLIRKDGKHLGALCIIDRQPRKGFDQEQSRILSMLADLAVSAMQTERGSTLPPELLMAK